MGKHKLICVGNVRPMLNDKIHQRNYIYDSKGVANTMTATMFKDAPRMMIRVSDKYYEKYMREH